ncbi:MAG: non-ribosomal peptide synthetase [Bacteroidota bacterium]
MSPGKPIPNNRIYILDSMQRLSPIGVPGEIYLGGEGLARGYFNRPELTAEKFIEHPVLGERLYRSGDIGRWLPSGDIEFLGRVDAQVKIRGNRIEIGEIERALCDVEGIAEAVVLVSGSKASEKYLRAFVLADRDFRSAETNDILRQHLPVYMLPSSYHVLDEIPMTSNGKIDRKVLAAIPDTREKSSKELVAARNDVERELLTIWEAVLQKEVLSIRDDFFELGGHSLKAMQLKSKIWESFQVDVPLTDFFNTPVRKPKHVCSPLPALHRQNASCQPAHKIPTHCLPGNTAFGFFANSKGLRLLTTCHCNYSFLVTLIGRYWLLLLTC